MDSSVKRIEYLASVAARRPEPLFASDAVMERIQALPAEAMIDPAPSGLLLTMAATASGMAAAVAVVASVAWADLHDPFLALQSLASVMEHLR